MMHVMNTPGKTLRPTLLFAVCVCLLAASACAQSPASPATDLALVKTQFRQSRWEFPARSNENNAIAKPSPEQIARWVQSQNADGSWSDINYTDQSRSFWLTAQHLKRTADLAAAYADARDHGKNDPALRKAILAATAYWIAKDYRNSNWWQNEIGVPNALSDILLVMETEAPPEQMAAGIKILQRSTLSKTGQNLVWQAGVVFKTALLQKDAALAHRAYDLIVREIAAGTQEGLQPDNSFHQHGAQPQFGNYGLAFASTMTEWAWIWRGTSWALAEDRLATLRGYLLDGLAATVANETMDISACGRQYFPGSPAGKGKLVLANLRLMAEVDPAHAAEYQEAVRRDAAPRDGGFGAMPGQTLNRLFYRSDYMVQRSRDFFASVRLCSRRVIGTELVNEENLLGRYLADGATFVYRTSQEYTDIFPVWDWRRIPGVTCERDGADLAPAGKMATDFAGGVSNGAGGACGLDYNRDGVTGRKSWFFFDGEIVCLGAGLTGSGHSPLVTSIEQSLRRGDTLAGVGGGNETGAAQAREPHLLAAARWVWHDNQGYIFPGGRNVSLSGGTQTGAWQKVFKSGERETVSREVFSLWLDHGVQPAAEYAYILLPGRDAKATAAYAAAPEVEILRNTPQAQAVRHLRSQRTMAVFFAAGELETASGKLTVDQPCALILREDGTHPATVTISDPAQRNARIRLTLGARSALVDLPQGASAGKSVEAALP